MYVGLVLKTCEQIFVLKNISRHEIFLVISRYRKTLVISTPNQIILCNYFEHLLEYLYDLDVFLYVSGIWMNTLLNLPNLLRVDLWIFPLFHFYSIACWPKVQNERNIYTNLNNCHDCFFMLCSYKNSCFCFTAMKINVRIKVNTQFNISRCSFYERPGWSRLYIDWFNFESLLAFCKWRGSSKHNLISF